MNKIKKIPAETIRPSPNQLRTICKETCVFYGLHPWEGDGRGDCEFEFLRRWLQCRRVPANCPRRLRKIEVKKLKEDPYAELRPQVMDTLLAHPSNFGFRPYQVANLLNGFHIRRRNSKRYNARTIKRICGALQSLRATGVVYSIGGRWFVHTREIVQHVFEDALKKPAAEVGVEP